MEYTNETKKGIYQKFVRLVEGFFIGAFSMFPFASTENLKESLQIKEVYSKEYTFGQKVKKYLGSSWSLLIGMMIGAVFFFLIPFDYLTTNFPFIIHTSVFAFAIGSCFLPLYRLSTVDKEKPKKKGSFLPLLCYFLAGIAILCGIVYVRPDFIAYLRNTNEIVYLALLVMIGSFFSEFCGFSFGSLLYLGGIYLTYADKMYEISYLINIKEKSTLVLLGVLAISFLVGNFLGFVLKNSKDRTRERSALGLGLYLFGAIYCATTYMKEPITTEIVDSTMAQYIILAACVFGSLVIALALSFYGFRGLNKTEFFIFETHEKDVHLHGLLTQGLFGKGSVSEEDDTLDADNVLVEEKKVAKEEKKEDKKIEASNKEDKISEKEETKKEETPSEEKKETSDGGLDLSKLKALSKELKK